MSIVAPLRETSSTRRSSRIKAKATVVDPNYESKQVEVSNDSYDKVEETVAHAVATKAKKAIPKATMKPLVKKVKKIPTKKITTKKYVRYVPRATIADKAEKFSDVKSKSM